MVIFWTVLVAHIRYYGFGVFVNSNLRVWISNMRIFIFDICPLKFEYTDNSEPIISNMRILSNRIFDICPLKFEYTGLISNMRILSNRIFDISFLKFEYTNLELCNFEYTWIYSNLHGWLSNIRQKWGEWNHKHWLSWNDDEYVFH